MNVSLATHSNRSYTSESGTQKVTQGPAMTKKGSCRKRPKFAKGHQAYPQRCVAADHLNSEAKIYSRLSKEVYETGIAGNQVPSILRPKSSPGQDSPITTTSPNDCVDGNRIVSLGKMMDLLNTAYCSHLAMSPKCKAPDFFIPAGNERKQGLGSSVALKCRSCKYESGYIDLFKKIHTGSSGRPAAEVNSRLGQHMVESQASFRDARSFLATLDCAAPNEKTIQRQALKAADHMEKLSAEQFTQNQKTLSELLQHNRGTDCIIACDTMYNNATKGGRKMPGTQASTPFIEMTTKKKLLVDVATHSKICCSRPSGHIHCQHDKNDSLCTANCPVGKALSTVEKDALCDFIKTSKETPLARMISHVLTDGGSQFAEVLGKEGIEHLSCIQHLKRGQIRKYYSVADKLSPGLFGKIDEAGRKRELAHTIAERTSGELTLWKKATKDIPEFFNKMEEVRRNMLTCISGEHSTCQQWSRVCRMHKNVRHSKRTSHVNTTRQFLLNDQDRAILQTVVNYR